jgi:hypothetical protein
MANSMTATHRPMTLDLAYASAKPVTISIGGMIHETGM